MSEIETTKVAIIGSGPAGWTAAIYAARANMAPIIFEGLQPGGQLTITTEVENYPGFPEGVQGPDLMLQFKAQAMRFDTTCYSENITKVDFSSRPFKIWSESREVQAETIIIATGATAKYLGLPGEEQYYNKGISACATCDGFFFRGKDVIVIGGGDSAVEEATFLTRFCNEVTLVHRRDELRASKIMAKRALEHESLKIRWNSSVTGYRGDENGVVCAVVFKDTVTGEEEEVAVQGVFMGIGHKPNTEIFDGILEMDEAGYLVTKANNTYTNVDGVFACGDVQDTVYRQAITASGTGCMAAIDAERWLEAQES